MKQTTLVVVLLACSLNIFTQDRVTSEDKTLLKQLSQDSSYPKIAPSASSTLMAIVMTQQPAMLLSENYM